MAVNSVGGSSATYRSDNNTGCNPSRGAGCCGRSCCSGRFGNKQSTAVKPGGTDTRSTLRSIGSQLGLRSIADDANDKAMKRFEEWMRELRQQNAGVVGGKLWVSPGMRHELESLASCAEKPRVPEPTNDITGSAKPYGGLTSGEALEGLSAAQELPAEGSMSARELLHQTGHYNPLLHGGKA